MSRLQSVLAGAMLALVASGCNITAFDFGDNGRWEFPDAGTPDDGAVVTTDASPDACVPAAEVCDGEDQDCDGVPDNGFDLQNDPNNCGACDTVCDFDHAASRCVDASCIMDGCFPGFHDLNQDPVDGCEYACYPTTASTELCDGRDNDCDGDIDEDFDFQNDPNNCGDCANVCVFLNGFGGCSGGLCTVGTCRGGFADANNDPNDGCECRMELTEGATPCTDGVPGTCAAGEVCADADDDGNAHCSPIPEEICDGKDNDCDGLLDGADDLSADARVGITCYGDPDGECAEPAHAGQTGCVNEQVVCTGANLRYANQVAETCNNLDDDCDGIVDDSPTDAGASCGVSSIFPCARGTELCVNGGLQCVGAINPGTETCNLIDDDCDGTIDNNLTDPGVNQACDVPPTPPTGVASACTGGTLRCQAGQLNCDGATGPAGGAVDSCGLDANCDGVYTWSGDTNTDIANCGSCGNNCLAGTVNEDWTCNSGTCTRNGCQPNYWDTDGNGSCEYNCSYQGSEICNNIDDDCNNQIDDNLTVPSPSDVCGVSPWATAAECTSGVSVSCVPSGGSASWQCTFPANVCDPSCGAATEWCDNLDNDCDGVADETYPEVGQVCHSDDGEAVGHGACRRAGTYECTSNTTTDCNAVKASCAPDCDEECDGVDNDCDGLVDEDRWTNSGDSFYVRPAVVNVGGVYMFAYEASRPNAASDTAGTGNGYHCTSCGGGVPNAPTGVPLDGTPACSVPGVLPWFNVTPVEVEQTCQALGGRVCTTAEYTDACESTTGTCDWGYGSSCTTAANYSNRFCNLGEYDFSSATGDQDGLLVTASPDLDQCWAEWGTTDMYDITGNLREITKAGTDNYPLMGGAYNTGDEGGATCDFDFYSVEEDFALLDTGFRCCFDSDPSL